jgi:DNA-binding NtrC family response regulator
MRRQVRVILLDDEPIVCERLKPALEKIGFYVEAFTKSQDVIDRFSEEKFDVLVTDVKMQKPDGLDVMNFVKQQSPATKVIIITGFATEETAAEAMEGGAVEFIAKPFKISQLRDLILSISDVGKE